MSEVGDKDSAERCAALQKEIARLSKINQVLMSRVERSMDMQGSAFSLFQAATALESQVSERTAELKTAMQQLERSNEQLRASKEVAESANRAKSQFLATMSHEIRTPLNGVLGMAEILQSTTLDRHQQSLLDTIVNSGQSLLSLINDILDLSRIEAGRMELALTDTAPRECIEGVVEMLAERAHAKKLELIADIEEAVPYLVRTDVLRLRQVLVNLIGNAIKFTDNGSIIVSADVESIKNERAVLRFSVRDTGMGIPEEKQARIFEPFTQADASTTRQHGGTGLGLTICRRLVELMGGQIGVHSRAGKGSTFSFTIQASVVALKDIRETALPALLGERLGIVIDNAELARVIAAHLRRAGAFVRIQDSYEQTDDVDALVVDDEFRERHCDVPVLTLTARLLAAESTPGHQGRVDYLMRPAKYSDLVRAVRRLREEVPQTDSTLIMKRMQETLRILRANILVAEDNPINREVVSEMLEGFGCQVTCAENGQEAIDIWRQGSFDLIVMDFQMPIMDGITATERIRTEELARGLKRIPIVALTANAFEDDRQRAMLAGCNAFLTKPISRAPLFDTLSHLYKGSQGAEQLPHDDRRSGKDRRTQTSGSEAVAPATAQAAPIPSNAERPQTARPSATPTPVAANADVPGDGNSVDGEETLDLSVIREIRAIGQATLLTKLVRLYKDDSVKKITAIRVALLARDSAALYAAAHSLKSASTNLGGKKVVALCRSLESAGKQGKIPDTPIDEIIGRIERECAHFCEQLAELTAEQAA